MITDATRHGRPPVATVLPVKPFCSPEQAVEIVETFVHAVDEAGDDATRTVTYTVTRTGTLTGELNVAIARSGTAAGGEDYDTPAAFLTTARILNGQTSVTFAAAVRKDNAVEPTETLRLTLAAGSNYGVDASERSTTATVSDDPPVVSLEKVQDGSSINTDASRTPSKGSREPSRLRVISRPAETVFSCEGALCGLRCYLH